MTAPLTIWNVIYTTKYLYIKQECWYIQIQFNCFIILWFNIFVVQHSGSILSFAIKQLQTSEIDTKPLHHHSHYILTLYLCDLMFYKEYFDLLVYTCMLCYNRKIEAKNKTFCYYNITCHAMSRRYYWMAVKRKSEMSCMTHMVTINDEHYGAVLCKLTSII